MAAGRAAERAMLLLILAMASYGGGETRATARSLRACFEKERACVGMHTCMRGTRSTPPQRTRRRRHRRTAASPVLFWCPGCSDAALGMLPW